MQFTSKSLSQKVRAQSTELRDLADAIDRFARQQQMHLIARGRSTDFTTGEPIDTPAAQEEHCSNLLPDPPSDPTAWRGRFLHQRRHETTAGTSKGPLLAAANGPV